jgi:hypothetical protein
MLTLVTRKKRGRSIVETIGNFRCTLMGRSAREFASLSHAVRKVLSLMRDQYEEKKVGLVAKVA